jgi:hypothetical protein
MPSIVRFCPVCGHARDGQKPFCQSCGNKYKDTESAPPAARDLAGAVQQVVSTVSAAQSIASSAASAVRGIENLSSLVLDGTPPPSWHTVVGETLPSVQQILTQKVVQAVEQKVVAAVQESVVKPAAQHVERVLSGNQSGEAPAPAAAEAGASHSCDACGASVDANWRFCLKCGKPLAREFQRDSSASQAQEKKLFCPRCGAEVARGWKFCMQCGNAMAVV